MVYDVKLVKFEESYLSTLAFRLGTWVSCPTIRAILKSISSSDF
jgi:hypothetical protein